MSPAPRATERAPSPPAQQLLRLLLGDPRVDPDDLDWSAILPIAERHRLMLRLMQWFDQRGDIAPAPFRRAADAARARNRVLLDLIARVGARCGRLGVPHVFLKAAQQFPDMPRDVNLLIPAGEPGTDEIIVDHVPAAPRLRARARLTGATALTIPGSGAVLNVSHGRLGRLGEHTRLPAGILERAVPATLGDVACFAPSPEDALLLQVLSRFYGRPALRLRDVLVAISLIKGGIAWERLTASARDAGLLPGLRRYLESVDQIHFELLDRPLLPIEARRLVDAGEAAPAAFRDDTFEYPATRVAAPLYLRQLASDIATGDWGGASRLFLLPLIAAAAGYRRLAHHRSGGSR